MFLRVYKDRKNFLHPEWFHFQRGNRKGSKGFKLNRAVITEVGRAFICGNDLGFQKCRL